MNELCGRIDQLSPAEAAAQILVSPLALETARLESQDQQFFFSAFDHSDCLPAHAEHTERSVLLPAAYLCPVFNLPGSHSYTADFHRLSVAETAAYTIFLTCHANFDYLHEALHLDCRDYILFPASAESIGQAVLKIVQRRIRSATLQNYGQKWLSSTHSMPERLTETTSPQDIIDQTVQYIIQTRMDLAVSLLHKSDAPITNIALDVSYNNYPYFTSAFKKYYGCTPSQYRADSRKEKE